MSSQRDGPRRLSSLARTARRKPLGTIGLVLLILIALGITLGPAVSQYDGSVPAFDEQLQSPSADHWAGTDEQGRDVLTRVLVAGRYSLTVGLASAALGLLISVSVGLISGYVGGATDLIVQRVVDAVMAIPLLLLLLLIMSVIGSGLVNVIVVLGCYVGITQSRVVRSAVLATAFLPFVDAARSLGASSPRLLFRHIWPNVRAPVIVIGSLAVGTGILAESSLSFLGYGVPPPDPTWGQMIGVSSRPYLIRAPWLAIAPGIALSIVVFSVNVLGDALRDLIDPRLRGKG